MALSAALKENLGFNAKLQATFALARSIGLDAIEGSEGRGVWGTKWE